MGRMSDHSGLALTPAARRAFDRQGADLGRVFAARLIAFVASTTHAGIAFVERVNVGDLDALGAMAETWHKEHLETPLLLTPAEFQRSLDVFPVEYQAIIDRHVVILGTPPFAGARVSPDELRRACEVQAKSHLLHLRQGWIDAGGHEERLEALVARSAAPLGALLTHVARLTGTTPPLPLDGARVAGLPVDLIQSVLALETLPEDAHVVVDRLPDYLAAAEALWEFVDRWHAH